MISQQIVTVSSLIWGSRPTELILSQGEAVEALGYRHHYFCYDEKIPQDTQIILIQGPYCSLVPLVDQLLDYPANKRPALAYWFQQSLFLDFPLGLDEEFSRAFSKLHQDFGDLRSFGKLCRRLVPWLVKTKGARLGFLGDLLWLHEHGFLDVLALSSTYYAEYLQKYQIPSIMVARGSAPSHGCVLHKKREIAVVWMGKLRTSRRKKAIYWLKAELEKRGLEMRIYDGEQRGFIYGDERTEILNKTWFVLNILSSALDELSIRYFISGANGAVVLSEPGVNKYPFRPEEHFVESEVKGMPDKILYYLEHEEEWQKISDNMADLLKNELTLEKSVKEILNNVPRIPE